MEKFSRYQRQWILAEIGKEGQACLARAYVAVIGLGALGSVSANLLARAGVGKILLVDRDFLELNNLQRQVLYDENDIRQNLPKAIAARKKLLEVNSEIEIHAEVQDLNPKTVGELLEGVDLIVDGTDNFETRFLLNDYALKQRIPWIYGGAIRTEGMTYVILPGEGPCLRCLFGEAPEAEERQTCDQVGILAPVAHLIASLQATEAIKILAGKKEAVERKLWKVDLWDRQVRMVSVDHLKAYPCSGCREGDFPYFNRRNNLQAVTLCGRNAVQIYGGKETALDFADLARKLSKNALVRFNDYLMKVNLDSFEMTVFQNGRAIIHGTEDVGQAKSLYARYIGA